MTPDDDCPRFPCDGRFQKMFLWWVWPPCLLICMTSRKAVLITFWATCGVLCDFEMDTKVRIMAPFVMDSSERKHSLLSQPDFEISYAWIVVRQLSTLTIFLDSGMSYSPILQVGSINEHFSILTHKVCGRGFSLPVNFRVLGFKVFNLLTSRISKSSTCPVAP